MDLGLAIYASKEVNSDIITEISNQLKEQFVNLNFGSGILSIHIGVICVSKDFEPFFIPRKPKYTRKKKEQEIDGIKFVTEKALEYDCKINFDNYQKLDGIYRKKLIASEVLKTTKEVFDHKKIKDFDSKAFINDLISFLESQKYI